MERNAQNKYMGKLEGFLQVRKTTLHDPQCNQWRRHPQPINKHHPMANRDLPIEGGEAKGQVSGMQKMVENTQNSTWVPINYVTIGFAL